jgi:hypothetical protein
MCDRTKQQQPTLWVSNDGDGCATGNSWRKNR